MQIRLICALIKTTYLLTYIVINGCYNAAQYSSTSSLALQLYTNNDNVCYQGISLPTNMFGDWLNYTEKMALMLICGIKYTVTGQCLRLQ